MASSRIAPGLVVAALGTFVMGCFFDASAFDGASKGGAGTTTTSGAGASDTTTSHGGAGGAPPFGGSTSSGGGGTGGSGAEGGATPVVPSDACPGTKIDLAPYTKLLIEGDTTAALDDFGSAVCGGGSSPDLVYQVKPLATGLLSIALTPEGNFDGFFQVRTICTGNDSEIKCGTEDAIAVTVNTPVYVIVDGHTGDPQKSPLGKFQLRLSLDSCGNGIIEAAGEECDDGNPTDDDTCTNDCKVRCTQSGSKTNDWDTYVHPKTHHCYMQSYGPNSNWKEASDDCKNWGGTLAALTPGDEISDLSGLVGQTLEDVWIGGTDEGTEGSFAWQTGETWSYPGGASPWEGGEPNGGNSENCVEIYKNTHLNDEKCSTSQNWMCERPPAGKLAQ